MTAAVQMARLEVASFGVSRRSIVLVGALVLTMSWLAGGQDSIAFTVITPLLPVFFATYPFINDERAHLDVLYAALPISRRDVVWGRYLFFMTLQLACGVLGFTLHLLVGALSGQPSDPAFAALLVMASSVVASMFIAIQSPVIFAVGYAKSRWLVMLPLLVFLAPTALLQIPQVQQQIGFSDLDRLLNSIPGWAPLALIAVFLAVWAISGVIASRVYAHRQL